MKKPNTKKLLTALSTATQYTKSLEDLQYNLTMFLNEDIYLSQIEKYGDESLLIVKYLLKTDIIFISSKDDRILLTPVGECLLIELNNMLFCVG